LSALFRSVLFFSYSFVASFSLVSILLFVAAKDFIKIGGIFLARTPTTFGRLEGNAVLIFYGRNKRTVLLGTV